MRTTIVIPTYNERENLRPLIERIAALRATVDEYTNGHESTKNGGNVRDIGDHSRIRALLEVLIVDDNSPDGTGALAEELAQEFPFVRVLHRPCKDGLGAALLTGFHHALNVSGRMTNSVCGRTRDLSPWLKPRVTTGAADFIVQMDADGSHDPGEIPKMTEILSPVSLRGAKPQRSDVAIPTAGHQPRDCFAAARNDTDSGADLVIGSRRVPGGRIVGWGLHRCLASRAAQALARAFLGFRTRDITSGFRVWRASALRGVLDEHPEEHPNDPNEIRMPRTPPTHSEHSDPHLRHSNVPLASGYAFQKEMLYRAEATDLRIAEHPITFRDRERGRSKLGLRDIVGFFTTCARLWWRADDHRFTVAIGAALVILTGLPYLYAWLSTPPGYVWTGVHALASGDTAVYASYLEQVRDGRWTFVDLFTSEWPQQPFLNIVWLAIGLIGRVFHLSATLTFHAVRIILIVPFTLFFAWFVAAFLRTPIAGYPLRTIRRTALLFLAFASGFGPFIANALLPISDARWRPGYDHWPMDLWVPESNTFLTLYQSPHFIASLWLLLSVLLATLHFSQQRQDSLVSGVRSFVSLRMTRKWRYSLAAGLAALALFQFHPFYVPTVFAVLGAWVFVESFAARRIRWDLVAHGVIVAAISAPAVLYHLWLVYSDPVTAWRAAQNILSTPAWWIVAVSYGALVPLALLGIPHLLRAHTPHARLLLTWLTVTVVLIFSPLPWQRRLTEGLHVAIVLAAIVGLFPLLAWLRPRLPATVQRYAWNIGTALAVAIPLLGLATLVNVVRDVALFTVRFPTTIPRHAFYYPLAARDAMWWIRQRAREGESTLALGIDGNFVPMFAARQTVVGHGVETTDFARKYRTAYALAAGTLSDADTRAFLIRERVRYVLVTDANRELWHRDPATLPGATRVFTNTGAEIYEMLLQGQKWGQALFRTGPDPISDRVRSMG